MFRQPVMGERRSGFFQGWPGACVGVLEEVCAATVSYTLSRRRRWSPQEARNKCKVTVSSSSSLLLGTLVVSRLPPLTSKRPAKGDIPDRVAPPFRRGTISRAEHWNPYSSRSRSEAAMSLSVEAHAERRHSGTDIFSVGGRFEVGQVRPCCCVSNMGSRALTISAVSGAESGYFLGRKARRMRPFWTGTSSHTSPEAARGRFRYAQGKRTTEVVLPIRNAIHAVRGAAPSVYSDGGTVTTAMEDCASWSVVVVLAVNGHMPFDPDSDSTRAPATTGQGFTYHAFDMLSRPRELKPLAQPFASAGTPSFTLDPHVEYVQALSGWARSEVCRVETAAPRIGVNCVPRRSCVARGADRGDAFLSALSGRPVLMSIFFLCFLWSPVPRGCLRT